MNFNEFSFYYVNDLLDNLFKEDKHIFLLSDLNMTY